MGQNRFQGRKKGRGRWSSPPVAQANSTRTGRYMQPGNSLTSRASSENAACCLLPACPTHPPASAAPAPPAAPGSAPPSPVWRPQSAPLPSPARTPAPQRRPPPPRLQRRTGARRGDSVGTQPGSQMQLTGQQDASGPPRPSLAAAPEVNQCSATGAACAAGQTNSLAMSPLGLMREFEIFWPSGTRIPLTMPPLATAPANTLRGGKQADRQVAEYQALPSADRL